MWVCGYTEGKCVCERARACVHKHLGEGTDQAKRGRIELQLTEALKLLSFPNDSWGARQAELAFQIAEIHRSLSPEGR